MGYLALTVVFAIVSSFFGLWQWDRRGQAVAAINVLEANWDRDPQELMSVEGLSPTSDQWTPVLVRGEYAPEDQMLVRTRPRGGQVGFEVLVPLRSGTGSTVVVNRGWIPIAESSTSQQNIPPSPQGEVKMIGYIQTLKDTRSEPGDLPINQINYLNPTSFSSQPLPTNYLQLASMTPMDNQVAIIPLPELSNGPHFSYAIQWILFALMLPIGWYVLLKNETK
jgi:cytochrome oxidase assembly protein ShyY1